jgi:hypothetical protein
MAKPKRALCKAVHAEKIWIEAPSAALTDVKSV